ncbi:MAG: hypothetical protein ACK5UO_14405, partial [Microcystis sp.]|uniref:hypothetical protein n=1 Tax=Microcystis sp. TaxID=1127 RepID=UPI00391DA3B3
VGCGVWGVGRREQGETIDNLRVNHTIKNGFGIKVRSSFTFHRILKKPLVIEITNGFLLGEITRNGIT